MPIAGMSEMGPLNVSPTALVMDSAGAISHGTTLSVNAVTPATYFTASQLDQH